jgi:monovalent cation:H+ antiporter-2, CPA2 family
MHQFNVIKDLVIILLVSVPIVFLFKKINLPSIVGFLIAGMLIGPFGFRLISEIEQVEVMAEIGVILLLFYIGLEVSFNKVYRIKKLFFQAGGMQVGLTILAASLIFIATGIDINKSIFYGMLVSLSSTAIVLKLLSERNETDTPHGKIALATLIFQDFAIVPMFILLPLLAAAGNVSAGSIALQLGKAVLAVVIIVVASRVLMPKILYLLASIRIREAFTIGIILMLLGTAYLTFLAGLSFALGAFIAGLILSESEFSHQIVSDVIPLKDSFNSIFFVSIGLLLNVEFVFENPMLLLGISTGILILKSSIIIIIVKFLKYPLRVAILTGISIAQVGEFSFVLAQAGIQFDLFPAAFYNAFIAASIFTMTLTPLLLKAAPFIALKISNIEPEKSESIQEIENHVVIAGFGVNGQNLARVLKETGIKYIVIELNPDTVRKEKEKGENIIFGDITKQDILLKANIKKAKVMVFAISDPLFTKVGVGMVKKLNAGIYTIVRTRFINEIEYLMKLGANEVIPEEFETSLQIFSKVLEKFHIPLNVIMKQVSILRGESYNLMRKETRDIHSFVHLDEILAAGLTDTYYVTEENNHIGKTLRELNLRAATDATIIAIVRGNRSIPNPPVKEKIEVKDTLVVTGTHLAVDKAFDYLNGKSETD